MRGLEIDCLRCGDRLVKPGALLFGPPDGDDRCYKTHLCGECWFVVLGSITDPLEPEPETVPVFAGNLRRGDRYVWGGRTREVTSVSRPPQKRDSPLSPKVMVRWCYPDGGPIMSQNFRADTRVDLVEF